MKDIVTPRRAAIDARREIQRMARPAGEFDASRYFRGTKDLGFYNVGTARVRTLARSIYQEHKGTWSMTDAVAFADALVVDRYLEVKAVAGQGRPCGSAAFDRHPAKRRFPTPSTRVPEPTDLGRYARRRTARLRRIPKSQVPISG